MEFKFMDFLNKIFVSSILILAIQVLNLPKSYADFESEKRATFGYPLAARTDIEVDQPTLGVSTELKVFDPKNFTPVFTDIEVDVTPVNSIDTSTEKRTENSLNSNVSFSELEKSQRENCPPRPLSDFNKAKVEKLVCSTWLQRHTQDQVKEQTVGSPIAPQSNNTVIKTYTPNPEHTEGKNN
jgi:hypothetical protein